MRKLIQYLRQCFCSHSFELIANITLYGNDETMPCGYKRVYHCEKCGYSYTLKY